MGASLTILCHKRQEAQWTQKGMVKPINCKAFSTPSKVQPIQKEHSIQCYTSLNASYNRKIQVPVQLSLHRVRVRILRFQAWHQLPPHSKVRSGLEAHRRPPSLRLWGSLRCTIIHQTRSYVGKPFNKRTKGKLQIPFIFNEKGTFTRNAASCFFSFGCGCLCRSKNGDLFFL